MSASTVLGQTLISVNSPGWKKVAYNHLSGGRGFGKITIYTTGGSYAPEYTDIYWYKDWLSQSGISIESNSNNRSYWSDARVTSSQDTTFVEVYFTRAIANNLYVKIDPYGWNPAKEYSGALSDGNGTIGATAKIHRFNLKDQFVVGFNGFVGIGTNNPQESLSVNGNIRAREVKVESTNWPDYVFDQGYEKMNLRDLEKFILSNKHLPEIPKASQVAAEGIKVGEMNKLLLKKIEELTLHLIEKDHQVESMENKLNELTERLNGMQSGK